MEIRTASHKDREEIRKVHIEAFGDKEGEIVSNLAIDMLSELSMPQIISLVAEIDGVVVGNVAFSPVWLKNDEPFSGYILAPLAVKPDHQKNRIGSNLVKNGIQQLIIKKVDVAFVYGDPKYYSRFGFRVDIAEHYTPPYSLQFPFGWQATILSNKGAAPQTGAIECVNSLCDPNLW
jgi:putative acetyltransferase